MARSPEEKKIADERLGPKALDYFMRFSLLFVNAAPMMLNIVVVIQLMRADYNAFQNIDEYIFNAIRLYGGDFSDGYVDNSNIPKQSGGYIWSLLFHLVLIQLILVGIAAELVVFPALRKISWRILYLYRTTDLISGDKDDAHPRPGMFLVGIFLYKIFLCILLFSQSFQPLLQFNNNVPDAFDWRKFAIWTTYATLLSSLLSIISRIFAWITAEDQKKRPW